MAQAKRSSRLLSNPYACLPQQSFLERICSLMLLASSPLGRGLGQDLLHLKHTEIFGSIHFRPQFTITHIIHKSTKPSFRQRGEMPCAAAKNLWCASCVQGFMGTKRKKNKTIPTAWDQRTFGMGLKPWRTQRKFQSIQTGHGIKRPHTYRYPVEKQEWKPWYKHMRGFLQNWNTSKTVGCELGSVVGNPWFWNINKPCLEHVTCTAHRMTDGDAVNDS